MEFPRMSVRRATAADIAGYGLTAAGQSASYVLEDNGIAEGLVIVAPRPFESECLGLDVRHVQDVRMTVPGRVPAPASVARLLEHLRVDGARLVSWRLPESERAMLQTAQAAGFHVIECLVTLGRPLLDAGPAPSCVSLADAGDAEGCARIGATAFRYDRFHADVNVDDRAADALKGAWARNAALGRADKVFVTRDGGTITGFNACLLRGDTAIIDLIGVAPGFHGQGLGRAVVAAALAHYQGRATRMIVGTQSANHRSLALYQGQGFRVENSALSLHAHLGQSNR
jgi:ribosomal protein S18 acetylase RimI-like enzyme